MGVSDNFFPRVRTSHYSRSLGCVNQRYAAARDSAEGDNGLAAPRPPALLRAFPSLYFGWVVTAGASLLAFVVVGVGFYCLAVLFDALCREHGWPATDVALATSLFFITSGVSGAFVGRGVDRYGPRVFFIPGALLMGGALVWIGKLDALWQLNVAYVLLAVGYSMAGAVPNGALITRWFVARRALAMSVSQTGVSLGGIVLVPMTTAVIIEQGVGVATLWLAALVIATTVIATLFLIRSSPDSVGQPTDGLSEPTPVPRELFDQQQRLWTTSELLVTRAFWIAVLAFSGILLCQVATAMHQLAMLREFMDPSTAALAVSATATGSIVARLVVGRFADRWNKRRLGSVLILAQAVALSLFAGSRQPWVMFVASLLFGATIGNIFMLQSLIAGEMFGMRSFGKAFGMLQLLTQMASGLGPYLLSLLVEGLGGYQQGLLPLVGLALVSSAVLSRLRPPPQSGGSPAVAAR